MDTVIYCLCCGQTCKGPFTNHVDSEGGRGGLQNVHTLSTGGGGGVEQFVHVDKCELLWIKTNVVILLLLLKYKMNILLFSCVINIQGQSTFMDNLYILFCDVYLYYSLYHGRSVGLWNRGVVEPFVHALVHRGGGGGVQSFVHT